MVCLEVTNRTVRASSSIGAPDNTAAGSTSPSSLPFITRFGTGEKVLKRLAIVLFHGKLVLR